MAAAAGFDDEQQGLSEEQMIDAVEMDLILRESIESVLNNQAFTHSKLDTWSNNVIEACLKRCTALGKPFKYVVTSHLTQKVGAGMHVASTSLTDPKTDGKLSTTWGNNTMQCVVTLYWLAI